MTADYSGTVSRIALNKVRYVAIFEGISIAPVEEPVEEPVPTDPPVQEPSDVTSSFNWLVLLVPLGLIVAAGGGIGIALFMKRRRETDESEDDTE